MKTAFIKRAVLAFGMVAISPCWVAAQSGQSEPLDPTAQVLNVAERPTAGPHGGSLKMLGDVQFETVVSPAGIRLYMFDSAGESVSLANVRGTVGLRVEGNPKRYRYDLLPDGNANLTAPVNLIKIAGKQIELEMQIVGLPKLYAQRLTLDEVITLPASREQQIAAEISRQKVCHVSGKPLGSMGQPVAVEIAAQTVYACCKRCVATIEANPEKFAAAKFEITVAKITKADAELVAKQKVCPVMDEPLGSMGQPVKMLVNDKPIFLCCKGCIKKIKAEPTKYLAMVYGETGQADAGQAGSVPADGEQVRPGIFKVSAADKPYVAAQKMCPVMDEPLDSMGGPYRVHAAGKAVYICCPGCAKRITADPEKYLTILSQQGVKAPVLR
ncbi:hypothetical protein SH139x_000160 [Planctomycetaceae bacterium SH139]